MRTTIEFDDDTAKAIDDLRRSEGIGVSEAVNTLLRRGLLAPSPEREFRQKTQKLGLRIDVSNVAEVLELLDESDDAS